MDYQELMFAIAELKKNLKETDYQAIKHSEGVISDSEYAPIKTQREEWRMLINEYENQLPNAEDKWNRKIQEQDQWEL